MERYTFIFEHKKGTYISQFEAESLGGAVQLWAQSADIPGLTENGRKDIISEIEDEDQAPVPLDGIFNVWCIYMLVENKGALLNIVLSK